MKVMNRKERRAFTRKARKSGISEEAIKEFLAREEMGLGKPNSGRDISDGEKIMLDLDNIKSHPNYDRKSQTYRNFVESHADEVFTAHIVKSGLIELKEYPEWLFWSGDVKPMEG